MAIKKFIDKQYLLDTLRNFEKIIIKSKYASIDSSFPTGGTTGQVLTKASNNDKDVKWSNAQGVDPDVLESINQAIKQKVDKEAGKGLSSNDLTDEMIQRWDGKSDFSGSYNDLTDKPEVLVDIDDAMSDTSENAIQNKVVKGYVDSSVGQIKKYQKYVNTELDYAQLGFSDGYSPVEGTYIDFATKPGNMAVEENKYVKLKSGKTYQFICSISYKSNTNVDANIMYAFKNITSNEVISWFAPYRGDKNYESSDTIGFQYTPNEDCTFGMFVERVYMQDTFDGKSTLSIFEIGRAIAIDPVEYVNEESGIEDTPVGHILTHMGTKAPKHYLICDGTEYNILDYPYLAEHIKEDFGAYNYFGGDGIATFSVPDLRGEFLRGTGINSHIDQGNGGDVGVHQDGTFIPYTLLDNNRNTFQAYWSDDDGASTTPLNRDSYMNISQKAGRASLNIYTPDTTNALYTTRPTNTSILYCIKYEPTYCIKTNDINYSYEEHCIGTWIDGKPLYEKTVNFGDLPNATIKNVPHGIENVGIMWISDGYTVTSDNHTFSMLQNASVDGDRYQWIFWVTKDDICSKTGIDRSDVSAFVTLRYTKTTDNLIVQSSNTINRLYTSGQNMALATSSITSTDSIIDIIADDEN